MKICFLTTPDSVHSHRWIKYFVQQSHDIVWLSLGVDSPVQHNDLDFRLIPKTPIRFLRPLTYFTRLRGLLKKINPDILHVHQIWIGGIIAALTRRHPFVLTAWGSDVLWAIGHPIKEPLVKYALRAADHITCDAEHMKDAMVSLGASPDKISIINFGTDTDQFSPGEKNTDLAIKLGVSGYPTIISLRSLQQLYDVQTLVKAAPLVLKDEPNAKFIIAGNGPEKENLVAIANDLGVQESIIFTGSIPNEELPEYLRLSDVYVSTALEDGGIAASTAEAMSCGLPAVITDFGNNKDWVEDGVAGYLVSLSDPNMLADRILKLLGSEEMRRKFGAYGRQVIQERNDWRTEMGKSMSLYEELVKKRS